MVTDLILSGVSVLNSIFWNNGTAFLSLLQKGLLHNYTHCSFYRIDRYLWAICNKKYKKGVGLKKILKIWQCPQLQLNIKSILMSRIGTYSNMYMIIAYSLSIYDKRLFQLIWQGSWASNSEINIFILIFFIFVQWPVLMYNPCIVLSMYLNRIVNLLTLTRANFDLGNSLTYFTKVHTVKSCSEVFLINRDKYLRWLGPVGHSRVHEFKLFWKLRPFEFLASSNLTMVCRKDIFGKISFCLPLFSFS